jgi:hypothetical protein
VERTQPVIEIKLPRIKLSHRLPDVHKEHAMLRRVTCRNHKLSRTDQIDEVFKEVKEVGGQD